MKNQEIIEQLKSLKCHCEDFREDEDSVWAKDVEALDRAIEAVERTEAKINLNEIVKFKLTDYGKDIYYHRFDEINKSIIKHGGLPIELDMPRVDSEGYTEMQLWYFMSIYGKYIDMGCKNIIEPLELIYKAVGQ